MNPQQREKKISVSKDKVSAQLTSFNRSLAMTDNTESSPVLVGPDLNASKSPLDKKVYRQILLPNGLRAVLVSDVAAMNQMQSEGGLFYDDGEEDDDDDVEEGEEEQDGEAKANEEGEKVREHRKIGEAMDTDDESDDVDGESHAGPSWLRDAAAALSVGVGSYSDPADCQGLSHFLGAFAS